MTRDLREILPESYFTLTVAERLKVLAETGRGGADVEWLAPNCWFDALQDTCREAAERFAMVEPAWMPVDQFVPPPYETAWNHDVTRMMLQQPSGYVQEGYGRWMVASNSKKPPQWRWYGANNFWITNVKYVRPMPEPFKET